jgi:hypothetical protein
MSASRASRGAARAGRWPLLLTAVAAIGALAVVMDLPARFAASPGPTPAEPTAADLSTGSSDDAERTRGSGALQTAPSIEPAPSPPPSPDGRRVLVSLRARQLWLVDGSDTLLAAPVAIGMGKDFTYNGRTYHFATPTGRRTILAKAKDPLWTVPEWHYYEKATRKGLEAVKLEKHSRIVLGDSTILMVVDDQVGRINQFGYFTPVTPGTEIIFDGKIFIPPMNTKQRHVPDALGPYKLDTGEGYLIHGTHVYNEESIGDAVSHGCVRMRNSDLEKLYELVAPGTPVIVY